jgi:hypothetical protein
MASRLDVRENGREHFSSNKWHGRPPDRPLSICPADGKVRSAGIIFSVENGVLDWKVGLVDGTGDTWMLWLLRFTHKLKKKVSFYFVSNSQYLIINFLFPENFGCSNLLKKVKKIVKKIFILTHSFFLSLFSNARKSQSNQWNLISYREKTGKKRRIFYAENSIVNHYFKCSLFRFRPGELMILQTPLAREEGERLPARAAYEHGETLAPGFFQRNWMRGGSQILLPPSRKKIGVVVGC